MRLAGVVVLYNPGEEVEENIKSYIEQLDILYIVDNSDKKNNILIKKIKENKKICYINNHGNQGIANALNKAAIRAVKTGCDFLLTMDQDSKATSNMLPNMLKYIKEHDVSNVGIVSPYQKQPNEKNCYSLKEYENMVVVMTSGNLLNLKAYRETGRFLDKLFIDMVDYEYCLRLNSKGYKVIRVNNAILLHAEGEVLTREGVSKVIHSPIRTYYYIRNFLYVRKKYKDKYPDSVKLLQKNCILAARTNLIYGSEKLKRIYCILRAFFDYGLNKYGRM